MDYRDYLKAAKALDLKPIRIDEFDSLAGVLDMNAILKLTQQIQEPERPLGKE